MAGRPESPGTVDGRAGHPPVSVVLPFHGTPAEAEAALDALARIDGAAHDEIIVVDNSGSGAVFERDGFRVLCAHAEHSSYYARNVGAEAATTGWLLFVDADCRPRSDILDRYFDTPVDDRMGALIGEVVGVPGQTELVARYARSRGHLGQEHHWRYPFRPWGVTANLLVRREAWADVGGFLEGIRSAGDTEFSWRLQDAGWTLDYRPGAQVEHRHRDNVGRLARQAARYAAGRAWVSRRYPGALERPTILRPLLRCAAGVVVWTLSGRWERARFKALDAIYVASRWAASGLSNTPPGPRTAPRSAAAVAIAGAFPSRTDPEAIAAVEAIGEPVLVEAASRPVHVDRDAARRLTVAWAEDDGAARRASAVLWLMRRRPRRAIRHIRRYGGVVPLRDVATQARRIAASGARQVRVAGDGDAERRAHALADLLGLPRG